MEAYRQVIDGRSKTRDEAGQFTNLKENERSLRSQQLTRSVKSSNVSAEHKNSGGRWSPNLCGKIDLLDVRFSEPPVDVLVEGWSFPWRGRISRLFDRLGKTLEFLRIAEQCEQDEQDFERSQRNPFKRRQSIQLRDVTEEERREKRSPEEETHAACK